MADELEPATPENEATEAEEPIKQDLVKMLVELAGKTGARTLAEGIETVEEYESCRELGIDLMQGYYIAHPHEHLALGDQEVANLVAKTPTVVTS